MAKQNQIFFLFIKIDMHTPTSHYYIRIMYRLFYTICTLWFRQTNIVIGHFLLTVIRLWFLFSTFFLSNKKKLNIKAYTYTTKIYVLSYASYTQSFCYYYRYNHNISHALNIIYIIIIQYYCKNTQFFSINCIQKHTYVQ